MRRYLLAGAAALALVGAATYALSQATIGFPSLFGNESVEAQLGIGGTSAFVTVGRLSNGRSSAYFTAFPTASFTIGGANPTGAATVSTVGVASGGDLLFNVTNGTAITITLPANPVIDGTIIGICNVTAAAWATNAVTVAANSNQTIVGVAGNTTLTTLAASTCNKWIWNQSATTWFFMVGG
jgi:hypothetical protein